MILKRCDAEYYQMASRGRRRRLAVRFLSESDVLWVDYGCWIRELYPSREAEMVRTMTLVTSD